MPVSRRKESLSPLQTRPDSIGSFRSAADSASVLRRNEGIPTSTASTTDIIQGTSGSLIALDSVELTLNSVADIAVVLAVIPLLIFTGPSQSDTASGAAIPLIIMASSPLLSWMMKRSYAGRHCLTVAHLTRLALAALLLYSPEFPFLSGGLLAILLSLSIAMRLAEIVFVAPLQARSALVNLVCFAMPATALFALLKFYNSAQPYLLTSAIALYSVTFFLSLARSWNRNATSRDTASGFGLFNLSLDIMPGLTAYEISLACIAGMVGIVPTVLSLTDQSAMLPALRADVQFSLAGWVAGCLLTIGLLSNRGVSAQREDVKPVAAQKQESFKVEHLHLIFTVLLGALSICKSSSIAYILLFLTSAIAASVSLKIRAAHLNRPRWQPALTMSAIVVASAFAYIDLSPRLCALQPIHVDRTLAAICFVPSLIAVFCWRGSRRMILQLVSYLVPVHNPLNQRFPLYVTRNLELTKAIMIGWRLNATIVVIAQNAPANVFVKEVLRLGNIHVLSLTDWNLSSEQINFRIADGETFLIFNFTEFEFESISPLPQKSTIGLIETVSEPDRIVISDMVLSSGTPLAGITR